MYSRLERIEICLTSIVDCLISIDHDLIYQNILAGPKYFGDSCNLDESNCVAGLVFRASYRRGGYVDKGKVACVVVPRLWRNAL